jgi:hypothetical protein
VRYAIIKELGGLAAYLTVLFACSRAIGAPQSKGGYKMHSHLNDPIVIKYWIFLIWEFLSITAMVALGIIALNVYFKRPF